LTYREIYICIHPESGGFCGVDLGGLFDVARG